MLRTSLWLGVLGLVLSAGYGCTSLQQARSDFHQTTDVQGVTLAVIETQNGSVEVQCNAAGTQADIAGSKHASGVTLEAARKRVEQIEIVVDREAGKPEVLHIQARIPPLTNGSAGASFRIGLPSDMAVTVRASNGAATVIGARRDVDLQTSNGRIGAEAIGGNLLARTSNGAIDARDVVGDVDAVSSNGGIEIQQAGRRRVSARTSNGRIRAIDPRGEVSLVSSNGSVEFKAAVLPAEPRVHIETSNGSVHVEAPRDARAALRLATSNARLSADLSGAAVADHHADREYLSATLNGGGGLIDARTSNGSVEFKLIPGRPLPAEAPATSPAGEH